MASPDTPSQNLRFGLPEPALTSLTNLFRKHRSIDAVYLYGSRAKGNYRNNSDIDLLLIAPGMDWSAFHRLESEIDDLLLPWKVDLALKHQVENQDLLDHVDRVGVLLFDGLKIPVPSSNKVRV